MNAEDFPLPLSMTRDPPDPIEFPDGRFEIGIDKTQAEYSVACLPEHLLAVNRAREHVFDDLHMLFDPVWHRTEVGAEHNSVHTAHLNRGSHSDGAETHAVDQDVGPEVVERWVNRAICQDVRALFSILQSVLAPWLKGPVPLQSAVLGCALGVIGATSFRGISR